MQLASGSGYRRYAPRAARSIRWRARPQGRQRAGAPPRRDDVEARGGLDAPVARAMDSEADVPERRVADAERVKRRLHPGVDGQESVSNALV